MSDLTVEEILLNNTISPQVRKEEFFRYYSNKRIQHQLKQLDMLREIPKIRLTEIGSYLGFATALFMAAGFKVQTIDAGPENILGEISPKNHISKNILDITSKDLSKQDIIVCCETLEHLEFQDVENVLQIFYASKTEWLLISVPYRCMSIDIRFVKNPFSSLFKWIVKLPTKSNQKFLPHPEPNGHKWELGYKGFPINKLTDALNLSGFSVKKIDYVGTVQSVFILCNTKQHKD